MPADLPRVDRRRQIGAVVIRLDPDGRGLPAAPGRGGQPFDGFDHGLAVGDVLAEPGLGVAARGAEIVLHVDDQQTAVWPGRDDLGRIGQQVLRHGRSPRGSIAQRGYLPAITSSVTSFPIRRKPVALGVGVVQLWFGQDRVMREGADRPVGALRGRHRIAALCDVADALAHQAAEQADAAVGRAQMLARVDRGRADADLGVVVARQALALLVGPVRHLAEIGAEVVPLHVGRIDRIVVVEADIHRVRVVERHRPDRLHRAREGLGRLAGLEGRRELVQIRHDHLGRAHPDIAADPAHPDIHHAERVLAEVELRG